MERVLQYCEKTRLKKGTWSVEEDLKLIAYINRYGIWNWNEMPKPAGLSRSGKSCRLRWMNYLRPDAKRGNFSMEEVETIIKMHEALGNKWSEIAANLPGRTDNEVKNFWHTHLKKHSKNPKPHRVKITKHGKNRVAELNTPLANGPEEPNLESSNYFPIILSPQFSSGDFSFSSKDDSSDGIGENQTSRKKNTACSSGTSEELINGSLQTQPFFMEESCGFYNDESTGFWVNLLMLAQQLEI